jgi:hypothetical protein
MIILQFIVQQLSPAKFCGFLLKSSKAKFKKALFSKAVKLKKKKIAKSCAIKSKLSV